MPSGVRNLNVPFSEDNFLRVEAWKKRWEAVGGIDMTWSEFLLLVANDRGMWPKRGGR